MNYDFLASIPWRLASLAGLLVGGISVAYGATDYLVILMRVGIAFAAFYAIGLASSLALRSVAGTYSLKRPGKTQKLAAVQAPPPADAEESVAAAS